MKGRSIVIASWVALAVFAAVIVPDVSGLHALDDTAVGVALALFLGALLIWFYAFGLAVVRSARGDDIGVGGLFFLFGSAPADVRRWLFGALGVSVVLAFATAAGNVYAALEPMFPLALVGLWGARHGVFPARDVGARPAGSSRQPRATRRRAMTDTASERIRIDASADRCFDVAVDFESYPEWLRDVKEAKVLESDDEGRGLRVEFRAAALGKSIRYVLAYDYTAAPQEFSWRFAEGDMLRRLDGSYRFEPEGPALTRVQYDLAVELAMPLPGLVKRRAAGLIMGSALKELKKQVEAVA